MSDTTTTGFDAADTIPEGAVIERVYFAVPEHYTQGQEYPTYVDALRAAVAKQEAAIAQSKAAHNGTSYVGERVTVDVRWKMTYPQGGGIDTVARRTTYATLAAANEHIARIEKYAGMTPR